MKIANTDSPIPTSIWSINLKLSPLIDGVTYLQATKATIFINSIKNFVHKDLYLKKNENTPCNRLDVRSNRFPPMKYLFNTTSPHTFTSYLHPHVKASCICDISMTFVLVVGASYYSSHTTGFTDSTLVSPSNTTNGASSTSDDRCIIHNLPSIPITTISYCDGCNIFKAHLVYYDVHFSMCP
jgi:hypothetical protein